MRRDQNNSSGPGVAAVQRSQEVAALVLEESLSGSGWRAKLQRSTFLVQTAGGETSFDSASDIPHFGGGGSGGCLAVAMSFQRSPGPLSLRATSSLRR